MKSARQPLQNFLPETHYEERPVGESVQSIILHSMHNPQCTEDPYSLQSCKDCLEKLELSVHYLIGLDGEIWSLVPEHLKAWHAGESVLPHDGKTGVNAVSIGIELVGSETTSPTEEQYTSLVSLCVEIINRHPITSIYGHRHIAPTRKTDPWNFDWELLSHSLREIIPTHNLILPEACHP